MNTRLKRRLRLEALESRRVFATVVDTLIDEVDGSITDGDVSLRDAIALGSDQIVFAEELDGGTVDLTLGKILLNRPVSIDTSLLPNGLTLNAANGGDLITIRGDDVSINGLTLTGGSNGDFHGTGVGVRVSGQRAKLSDCSISGSFTGVVVDADSGETAQLYIDRCEISNNVRFGVSAYGAAGSVYSSTGHARIVISSSTISENEVGVSQHGVGALVIDRSTISGNRGNGVEFHTESEYGRSSVEISSSTISGNELGVSASSDDDIQILVKVEATTITGNTNGGIDMPGWGFLETRTSILAGNGSLLPDDNVRVSHRWEPGSSLVAGDPHLKPLANNGGLTKTHAILPGSPAINFVDPTTLDDVFDHDQRGELFARVNGGGMDAGAFEYQTAPLDFNMDGQIDCEDADIIVSDVASTDYRKRADLTSDGILDQSDLDVWLTLAGIENLASHAAYLPGDGNLDGRVDAKDLNAVAINWQQKVTGWFNGDFNADGIVNALDLNELALNWQQDVTVITTVPAARSRLARNRSPVKMANISPLEIHGSLYNSTATTQGRSAKRLTIRDADEAPAGH